MTIKSIFQGYVGGIPLPFSHPELGEQAPDGAAGV